MDAVRQTSRAVNAMSADWPTINALLGGTVAMRAAGKMLLPQWPNESQRAYDIRLAAATLFPAYARTIDVLSAKPFSRPIQYSEDMPSQIKAWTDDIDLEGRGLHNFAADSLEAALGKGICGILVEFPRTTATGRRIDEKVAGVRPYFVHIKPEQFLGWRYRLVKGKPTLTQFRFLETVTEDAGEFGETDVEQVRVLYPGRWEIYRENDKHEWVIFDQGATTLPVIPFVPVYGQRTGFMTGVPPLRDVAYMNVEHWQSKSDQQTILHYARIPILTMIGGGEDTQITIGGSQAVKVPLGGDLKFTEHTGAAIGAGRQSLLDLQDQMRQAGAELLVIQPVKAVAQVESENEAGLCALGRTTLDLQDSLNQALWLMAQWVHESTGGTVEIYKDFGFNSLSEADADLLLKMATAGKLSDETFFDEARRRGLVAPDRTWAQEQERLNTQGPALGNISVNGQ